MTHPHALAHGLFGALNAGPPKPPGPGWVRAAALAALALWVHLHILNGLLDGPSSADSPTAARPLQTRALPAPAEDWGSVAGSVSTGPLRQEQRKAPPTPQRDAGQLNRPLEAAETAKKPSNVPFVQHSRHLFAVNNIADELPNGTKERTAQHMLVTTPTATQMSYLTTLSVRGAERSAQSTLQWLPDGGNYQARLTTQGAMGRGRLQTSEGRITAAGLAPSRYSDKTRGERATHFDAEQGLVSFSNNRPHAAWVPGMQDRLSVLVQVAAMMATDFAKYPTGSTLRVPTATSDEAGVWEFRVDELLSLSTPMGELLAVRLVRDARREFEPKVEVWLSPAQQWLPVRMRTTQANGDFVDHQLQSVASP